MILWLSVGITVKVKAMVRVRVRVRVRANVVECPRFAGEGESTFLETICGE